MDGPLAGGTYEIVIGAALGLDWAEWFDGFEVEESDNRTVLRGTVRDQSALYGILALLRDLAVPLLDVHHVEESGAAGLRPATDIEDPSKAD